MQFNLLLVPEWLSVDAYFFLRIQHVLLIPAQQGQFRVILSLVILYGHDNILRLFELCSPTFLRFYSPTFHGFSGFLDFWPKSKNCWDLFGAHSRRFRFYGHLKVGCPSKKSGKKRAKYRVWIKMNSFWNQER